MLIVIGNKVGNFAGPALVLCYVFDDLWFISFSASSCCIFFLEGEKRTDERKGLKLDIGMLKVYVQDANERILCSCMTKVGGCFYGAVHTYYGYGS